MQRGAVPVPAARRVLAEYTQRGRFRDAHFRYAVYSQGKDGPIQNMINYIEINIFIYRIKHYLSLRAEKVKKFVCNNAFATNA